MLPIKLSSCIADQFERIFVPTRVEEICGDNGHAAPVERRMGHPIAHFRNPHDADNNCSLAGPLDLRVLRKIVPPFVQIHRSPVDRVSPWPMVLVAIRPKHPSPRSKLNARRKKCATRSALPFDSS